MPITFPSSPCVLVRPEKVRVERSETTFSTSSHHRRDHICVRFLLSGWLIMVLNDYLAWRHSPSGNMETMAFYCCCCFLSPKLSLARHLPPLKTSIDFRPREKSLAGFPTYPSRTYPSIHQTSETGILSELQWVLPHCTVRSPASRESQSLVRTVSHFVVSL